MKKTALAFSLVFLISCGDAGALRQVEERVLAEVDTRIGEQEKKLQAYLARIEELAGVPVDIVSTGPDREQTIIKSHPFG